MTDKEYGNLKRTILCLCSFIIGSIMSGFIVTMRINSEIRTDQVELQAQVEEILEQKQEIEGVIREFSRQAQLIQAERESLERLKILLSKGE